MPSSQLYNAPEVLALVAQSEPHDTVLDVGPGRGKYGLLLREYVDGIARVEAIEAWHAYITERLACIYDELHRANVLDPWVSSAWFDQFDVVLLVDVLEHLERDDGADLLARIPCRVVISTPAEFFQNPEAALVPTEEHRSLWGPEDFQAMDRCEVAYVNEWGAVLARLGPQ